MINPKNFTNILNKNGINFYTGVPDSLMKSFCNYIEGKKNHISSVSEGSAIGIGIGYHLATGKIPLIYFQNSGIGNIVNPIISLVNKKVFNIPLLLLVGWRGETFNKRMNVTDEPQHRYQGLVTEKILKLLQIKYKILNKNSNYSSEVKKLITYSRKKSQPVALLVRKGSFLKIKKKKFNKSNLLKRRQILKIITDNL